MKKIAVFEAEFESENLISEEDLKEFWDNNWLKFMKEMYEDEGNKIIGMFDKIELVEVIGDKE